MPERLQRALQQSSNRKEFKWARDHDCAPGAKISVGKDLKLRIVRVPVVRPLRQAVRLGASGIRHKVTGESAGLGLFLECPSCPAGARVEACPLWGKPVDAPPVAPYTVVTYYYGVIRSADSVGAYTMEVDRNMDDTLRRGDARYCVDATSTRGGYLGRYINGTRRSADGYANCSVGYLGAHKVQRGRVWARLPVYTVKKLKPHSELFLPYGADYFKQLPNAKDYVMP